MTKVPDGAWMPSQDEEWNPRVDASPRSAAAGDAPSGLEQVAEWAMLVVAAALLFVAAERGRFGLLDDLASIALVLTGRSVAARYLRSAGARISTRRAPR